MMIRSALLTLVMLALCWPAWVAAGWLLEALALTEFDLLGRAVLVFVVLGLAEAALRRLRSSEGENHG
jgi:hypothetical protein